MLPKGGKKSPGKYDLFVEVFFHLIGSNLN